MHKECTASELDYAPSLLFVTMVNHALHCPEVKKNMLLACREKVSTETAEG